MATQYAFGKIVTDGLVLALDAADRNSYVSGSTTWFDLSGNNNSGSLINGPTFSSANGGSIVFDGSNDHINCGTSPDIKFTGTSPYTVEVWANQQVTQSGFPMIWSNENTVSAQRQGTNLVITTTQIVHERWASDVFTGASISRNINTGILTPIHIVATNDGTTLRIYANAISGSTGSSTTPIVNNITPFTIGARGSATGNFFNGFVYACKIYNRALSAQEVLQNYNAQKSRFNL